MNPKGGVFIRKFLYYCQLVLVLSVTWWVLHGFFSPLVLISGPMVSLFVIYICEKYILRVSFYEQYYFNLPRLVLYTINLVYHIYLSGLSVLPTLFTGKARPALIEVPTQLKEPYLKALVSNSITLTPGTISISVLEEGFEVLWLNPITADPERAGNLIKGAFEKPLLEARNE